MATVAQRMVLGRRWLALRSLRGGGDADERRLVAAYSVAYHTVAMELVSVVVVHLLEEVLA